MDSVKLDRIKSHNQSETEVLHCLFENPNFKVRDLSLLVHRSVGGIRTNLTAVFDKLGAPKDGINKREWVVREYSEVYEKVFKRGDGKPEMFIKPPDPIIEIPSKLLSTTPYIGAPILFYSDFNSPIDPQLIRKGTPTVSNSYLSSEGETELVIGNGGWINYVIFARLHIFGSDSGAVIGKHQSFIAVRNYHKKYRIAHRWFSGNVKGTNIEYFEIRVYGNCASTRVTIGKVGSNFLPTRIPKENGGGGVVISLNTGSHLDYLLIVELPNN